jgi:hypothetical protein
VVQLDVFLHGHGVGTAWVRALRPGDTVSAIGPRGRLLLNPDAGAKMQVQNMKPFTYNPTWPGHDAHLSYTPVKHMHPRR